MADVYAPALFLEVLAFWFVLRWLLAARLILFFGRILVLMMLVGVLETVGEQRFVWAACFACSAVLAWVLLRRWRGKPHVAPVMPRLFAFLAWRGKSADEVAALCERRIGVKVEAAAPAIVSGPRSAHCVLALAGDGVWVLEDQSRIRQTRIGRVLACWDRTGLVAHLGRSHRGECFEFSWPRRGALVRGRMPCGPAADQVGAQLIADELARS